MTGSASTPRRLEQVVAALVFAVPLYYAVTERTREVFVVTWSKPWTAFVIVYVSLYVGLLWSYARELPRWLGRLRRVIVITATALLLALVCFEIVLRISDRPAFEELPDSGRHAADPDVGHVYVANHSQRLNSREFSIEWKSNAQGVRAERDFGPKEAGVVRVLACGDSFTEGAQVPYADTWPAALESCLNEALEPARVEVVNAGFLGFATVNEARWIAKFGAAFEPDLVLIAMTPDDLLENQTPLQYAVRDGMLVSSTSTDADRARSQHRAHAWCLAGVVERSLVKRRIDRSNAFKRLFGRRAVADVEAYMVEPNEKATRVYELAEKYLLEARDAAAGLGAKFGVVVIPDSQQLRELGAGLDPRRFGEHWVEVGREHGFPVVDCLPAFVAHPDPRALHWKEDRHCTALGYRTVGDETCRALLARASEVGLPSPTK